VEKKIRELNRLDLKTRIGLRPPQVGDIDGVHQDDIPKGVRQVFERTAGRMWNQIVSELLDWEGFEQLPAEEQVLAIRRAKRDALAFARATVEASFPVRNLP